MAFFGKGKVGLQTSAVTEYPESVAQPSSSQSDFEKTFKPFVLKKEANLAPVNWFLEQKGRRKSSLTSMASDRDVIVVDDDTGTICEADGDTSSVKGKGQSSFLSGASAQDVIVIDGEGQVKGEDTEMQCEADSDISSMSAKGLRTAVSLLRSDLNSSYADRLKSALLSLRSSFGGSHFRHRSTVSPRLKTYYPITVRDLMSQLTEAEVAGDISCVRSYSNELNSLTVFPRKVLIFREDFRPGYFGTWTRNSATIGPRCPFAKDLAVFDYGYDSAEEWEEEGEADDVVDDGEEEDGEIEDPDSDLDSWLVDDDDDDVQPPSHESSPPLSLPEFYVSPPPKRKSNGEERKLGKKRKVVVPLLPFAKGPCWETPVTWCENDLFKPYQIRLFNGQL